MPTCAPVTVETMKNLLWFVLGAVLSTFVGATILAILRARGINPVASVAGFFSPTVQQPAAETTGG